MSRSGQVVNIEYDSENYGRLLGQMVERIVIDDEGYAFGFWKGRMVGSFHIDNGEWFVLWR